MLRFPLPFFPSEPLQQFDRNLSCRIVSGILALLPIVFGGFVSSRTPCSSIRPEVGAGVVEVCESAFLPFLQGSNGCAKVGTQQCCMAGFAHTPAPGHRISVRYFSGRFVTMNAGPPRNTLRVRRKLVTFSTLTLPRWRSFQCVVSAPIAAIGQVFIVAAWAESTPWLGH